MKHTRWMMLGALLCAAAPLSAQTQMSAADMQRRVQALTAESTSIHQRLANASTVQRVMLNSRLKLVEDSITLLNRQLSRPQPAAAPPPPAAAPLPPPAAAPRSPAAAPAPPARPVLQPGQSEAARAHKQGKIRSLENRQRQLRERLDRIQAELRQVEDSLARLRRG